MVAGFVGGRPRGVGFLSLPPLAATLLLSGRLSHSESEYWRNLFACHSTK
jgi:hypothetical protein